MGNFIVLRIIGNHAPCSTALCFWGHFTTLFLYLFLDEFLHQLLIVFVISIHEVEAIDLLQSQIKGRPFGLEILDLIISFFLSFLSFIKSLFDQFIDVDFFVLTV
jgi:hypothetical protein